MCWRLKLNGFTLHVQQVQSESQPFSPTQRSPASSANPLSPRATTPTDPKGHVPRPDPQPPKGAPQSIQGSPVRSPTAAAGGQQSPKLGIGGSTPSSMQRGGSLNVPAPMSRTAGGLKGNWGAFWEAVMRDHCHAGLIWNEGTRAELREALQVCYLAMPCRWQVALPLASLCRLTTIAVIPLLGAGYLPAAP